VLAAYENVTAVSWTRPGLAVMAVQEWLDSPAHRANLFGQHDTSGVGVVRGESDRFYITQLYLRTH
jgi:uncharacterized protein YkwD